MADPAGLTRWRGLAHLTGSTTRHITKDPAAKVAEEIVSMVAVARLGDGHDDARSMWSTRKHAPDVGPAFRFAPPLWCGESLELR